MAHVDKRMYYLERLNNTTSKPKESLASAVARVRLLAEQLYPSAHQQRNKDNDC